MSEAGTGIAPLEPPTEVAVRAQDALMSDDEIRRTYRIAEALYASGAYKDVKQAETAFAKMVIGRDLGLSPAQSMGGIHLVEGGVQMHYAMLGQFVRARHGYDYRPGWIKEEDDPGATQTAQEDGTVDPAPQRKVVVWHDEEDPADMRDIVGAVVDFTINGERRGVSRFTLDDARAAGLIKDSAKAAWNTSPRNMLLARAISNGVKWYVPEVLGGLPVYVEGELPAGREERKSLTAPSSEGADADEGQGIDLGPAVEKLIARATEVGHRGLSNRVAVEAAVGQRSPGVIKEWVVKARAELDRFEAEKQAAATAEPGADAEPPAGAPEEVPVEAPAEEVTVVAADVQDPPEQAGEITVTDAEEVQS